MIDYTINFDKKYANEDIILHSEYEKWDKKTLKELREKYNIFFRSNSNKSCISVMLNDDTFSIGIEHEGTIHFHLAGKTPMYTASIENIPALIEDLKEIFKFYYKNKG